MHALEEVVLTVEEMEAIRLADIEQLDQAAAASRMEISSPTFNRMVNQAHKKIATALWQGTALRVEGGNFRLACQGQRRGRQMSCEACSHRWELPRGGGHFMHGACCPVCLSDRVRCNSED